MTSAPRRSSIEVEAGLILQVEEWGAADGWPLVILHGGGHRARSWESVCRALPHEIRCIVPDQRGHGASNWAPEGDYSCDAQVRDLEQLLRALQLPRVALLGHSMGGLNTLQFAGLHPERVRALVLVDVGTETRESGLERVRAPGRQPIPSASPGDVRPPFDTRLLDFVPTYCGDREERQRLLAATSAPLLVMRGAHSRILTAESAARTAELGSGKVVEIPESGHNVSLRNPEAVARHLSEFLEPLMVDLHGAEIPRRSP